MYTVCGRAGRAITHLGRPEKARGTPNRAAACTHPPTRPPTRPPTPFGLPQIKKAGVQNVLALRGDPPKGQDKFEVVEGGFACALDLVKYIRCVGGRPGGWMCRPPRGGEGSRGRPSWCPHRRHREKHPTQAVMHVAPPPPGPCAHPTQCPPVPARTHAQPTPTPTPHTPHPHATPPPPPRG